MSLKALGKKEAEMAN
jgi:hypothetical protein